MCEGRQFQQAIQRVKKSLFMLRLEEEGVPNLLPPERVCVGGRSEGR